MANIDISRLAKAVRPAGIYVLVLRTERVLAAGMEQLVLFKNVTEKMAHYEMIQVRPQADFVDVAKKVLRRSVIAQKRAASSRA